MKNRMIPYGYRCQDGVLTLDEHESQVVKDIFKAYLAGSSLGAISKMLTERGEVLMPGTDTAWNKSRVSRILSDARYLGNAGCPTIIDQDSFERAHCERSNRNTQTGVDRTQGYYQINVPVRCSICGATMKRSTDQSRRIRQKWVCSSEECKTAVSKADESLTHDLTGLLNQLINHPDAVQCKPAAVGKRSERLQKLERKIGRLLDHAGTDKQFLRKMIQESVSLKYEELDSNLYLTHRLKNIFERESCVEEFPVKLFRSTVREIVLEPDGTVCIVLDNNQIVRRDLRDADRETQKGCPSDSGNTHSESSKTERT